MNTPKYAFICMILSLPLLAEEKPGGEINALAAKYFFKQARFIISLQIEDGKVVRSVNIKGGKPDVFAQGVIEARCVRMPQSEAVKDIGGVIIYELNSDEAGTVRSLLANKDGSIRRMIFDLQTLQSLRERPPNVVP